MRHWHVGSLAAAVVIAGFLPPAPALAKGPDPDSRRLLLAEMLRVSDKECVHPPLTERVPACCKRSRMMDLWAAGLDPSGNASEVPGGGGVGGSGPFADRGPGGGGGGGSDLTDVLHNTLDVEVAPPGGSITGSNTMLIRSLVNGLSEFMFQLRSNYTVTDCIVTDSVGSYSVIPTGPSANSYTRTINLLRSQNVDDEFTVRVEYNGTLPQNVGLGSVRYGTQNGGGGPATLCTLSEPYYAGTWWPCKDGDVFLNGDNIDKATVTVSITAPDNFISLANGVMTGEEMLSGSRKKYTWDTSYPMSTYLVFLAVSEYNRFDAVYDYGEGTMPVEFFIYTSDDTPARRDEWLKVVDMLAAFRTPFGLYPFINEKYGIYQFEFPGGMEHQTFSGQGGANGIAFLEYITAHELVHQWFGDDITCRTWSDIWLNEGFATYGEALWEELKPGSTGLPALKAAMLDRKPFNFTGSVYVPPSQVSNPFRIFNGALSYDKAAWILHQLRHIVGDEIFFQIIQTYRQTFSGGAPTTADFTALASSVAGRDLNWFFNPWLYDIGGPSYHFGWEPVQIHGQWYVRLMIRQTQSVGPLFPMPMDIQVTTTSGTQTHVVFNDALTDHYLLPIGSEQPTDVQLDVDNWILEYGKFLESYQSGPPRVVVAEPAPGTSIIDYLAPTQLVITFSDDVVVAEPDIQVLRDGNPVPFTLSYSPAAGEATLQFGSALAAGDYSVVVSDAVSRADAPSVILDGELANASDPASLPSGDGAPGGMAAWTFSIYPDPCPADFNHSGTIGVQDIFDFLAAYFSQSAGADFNHSGTIGVQDIFDFLAAYFAGCD